MTESGGAAVGGDPGGPLSAPIVERLLSLPLDAGYKGIATPPAGSTVAGLPGLGWSVGGDGLLPPVAVLRAGALEHNLELMAAWCRDRGLSLAPHGKTTMAPQIIDRQLALGAWAITTGSVAQTRTLAGFGVRRLLLAHQVYDDAGLAELGAVLGADSDLEIICLVDSVQGVERMDGVLSSRLEPGRLQVLLELGVAGGRTGCRSNQEAADVVAAVERSRVLRLRGIEGYEGVIGGDADPATLAAVDDFLDRIVAALDLVVGAGEDIVLSAGGSAFFDRVAVRFGGVPDGVRRVLRSGCYVIHDHGKYHRISPLDGRSSSGARLRPALEVWTAVASRPEADMVVLNAGRRDLSFDAGLPVAVAIRRRDGAVEQLHRWLPVVRLNDQHAVLSVPADLAVAPGDLVALGISHPCTTFDKWKLIPVVDDGYGVVGAVVTYF